MKKIRKPLRNFLIVFGKFVVKFLFDLSWSFFIWASSFCSELVLFNLCGGSFWYELFFFLDLWCFCVDWAGLFLIWANGSFWFVMVLCDVNGFFSIWTGFFLSWFFLTELELFNLYWFFLIWAVFLWSVMVFLIWALSSCSLMVLCDLNWFFLIWTDSFLSVMVLFDPSWFFLILMVLFDFDGSFWFWWFFLICNGSFWLWWFCMIWAGSFYLNWFFLIWAGSFWSKLVLSDLWCFLSI